MGLPGRSEGGRRASCADVVRGRGSGTSTDILTSCQDQAEGKLPLWQRADRGFHTYPLVTPWYGCAEGQVHAQDYRHDKLNYLERGNTLLAHHYHTIDLGTGFVSWQALRAQATSWHKNDKVEGDDKHRTRHAVRQHSVQIHICCLNPTTTGNARYCRATLEAEATSNPVCCRRAENCMSCEQRYWLGDHRLQRASRGEPP